MKHSVIFFLVNVVAVIAFNIHQAMTGLPDFDKTGWSIATLVWGAAMLINEHGYLFRIRLLEHQKRQLELQLGFRQSISNSSKP